MLRSLIALLLLAAPASAGDGFSWAITDEPGFSWAVTDHIDVESAPPSRPDVSQYVHQIDVNGGRGSCVCIGRDELGNMLFVTAGHILRDRRGTAIKIDGVQYGGQWSVSSYGDAAVMKLRGVPDMPVANYERRAIEPGESLVIYGQKTGLHSATGTEQSYTTKELQLRLSDGITESGDSGGGVFDESGVLVAVHGGRLSDSESLCTPLSMIWANLPPFDSEPSFSAVANNNQSRWLDGFTGIYLATASWCGPCKTAHKNTVPKLEAAGWPVKDMDADTEKAFMAAFNIQSLPTFIVVQNGVVIARTTGSGMPTTEGPEVSAEVAYNLSPDEQPTPYSEVTRILGILKPRPDEVFVDYGCGDGRFCIEAARTYGCRAVGVEIDPERAAAAREAVAAASLSDRVEIIEGDATTVDVDADVGVVYLWPDTLEALKPKLQKLDRFVSFQHTVPGLSMTRNGDAYIWRKPQPVAARPYAVYQGRMYYGPVCNSPNCSMCNAIRRALGQ